MTEPTIDPNRYTDLFDLARRGHEAELSDVSAAERREVAQLRALLDLIDASWQAMETQQERVRRLFLAKLAANQPERRWFRAGVVQTLGDLVEMGGEDLPALPAPAINSLRADATPLATLLDPTQRTAAIGQAIHMAAVPLPLVGEFLLWLNRVVAELVPQPGATARGLLFTRRQERPGGRQR